MLSQPPEYIILLHHYRFFFLERMTNKDGILNAKKVIKIFFIDQRVQ